MTPLNARIAPIAQIEQVAQVSQTTPHATAATPTSRRRFIAILPLAGSVWLAACSKKEDTGTPAAMPSAVTPAPTAPVPAPAPVAPEPAPAPTSSAAPAAATGAMVDENDATARGLGYVADAKRTDTAKFKNYTPGMACSNCSLFGGKTGDASGPCPLFAGRQVAAQGWCSAYVKKTG